MKAALIQMTSGDDPAQNLQQVLTYLDEGVSLGAQFLLTPEVTNCVSLSRAHQEQVLCHQQDDPTLAAVRSYCAEKSVWVLLGSLALKTGDADGRFANRSFLIDPQGAIAAWYDKIHMFDVQVTEQETFRESAGYRPGDRTAGAKTPFGNVGLTVCYDMRFPHLYRTLAQAGADILTVPAAFSPVTGRAHWESLLRARAIENGCYVLAPAQTGHHPTSGDKVRETYGHSLAVDPWGKVILDAGTKAGVYIVDLEPENVAKARQRVPSITHDRKFSAPEGL